MQETQRKWYLIDLKDKVLGRTATKVAGILQGKNKGIYSRSQDMGDSVILINAKDIKLTGKKAEQKIYYSHTKYPGSGKARSFAHYQVKNPVFPVKHAIRGMLPKTNLGRKMIKRLFIYADAEHPHAAQKPETLTI